MATRTGTLPQVARIWVKEMGDLMTDAVLLARATFGGVANTNSSRNWEVTAQQQ
jgi:hypothetical protein